MKTLYINGKFLLQRMTGVQRFAHRLIMALDNDLLLRPAATRVVLLKPEGAPSLPLQVIEQKTCGYKLGSTTLWEQIALPMASRDGPLLCLSGSAPMLGGTRIPTIHDAAVYLYPHAYSWRFVAWYRMLFRVITRAAPLQLTVSARSANELAQQLTGREFKVIPNSAEHILATPSDVSVLRTLGISEGRYLLAVGSLNPTKNLSALIAGYATANLATELPLVIVGASNASVFATALTAGANTPGVLFAGSVSDAALRALYEHASAFVFPSLYEGFGIPPLEAMTCGCPVVASHASSIPEVCADAAMYFDATNVPDIARALRTITNDPALRADLAARGRARSMDFTWSKSATLLRNHLQCAGLLEDTPT